MEVVAATASVAGILTVVGQGIESIIKLREFYAALSEGSRTIEKFLKDINNLLQTLHGIRDLLKKWPQEKTDVNIAALSVQVEECSKDLFNWLDTAKAMRPASGKGGKAWFKKFWIAANKNRVKDIRTEIGRHVQTLNVSLALIGRTFDVHASQQINHVDDKIKKLTLLSTSGFDSQQQEFEKWGEFRHASSASNAGSMQSLQSIASSLSRLEARFPAPVAVSSDVLGSSSQPSFSHMFSQCAPPPSPLLPFRFASEGTRSPEHEDKSLVQDVIPTLMLGKNARKRNASISSLGSLASSPSAYSWVSPLSSQDDLKRAQGTLFCTCCPKNSRRFATRENLELHEKERKYRCHYCSNRFSNQIEAERHHNALHRRSTSWSCANLNMDHGKAYFNWSDVKNESPIIPITSEISLWDTTTPARDLLKMKSDWLYSDNPVDIFCGFCGKRFDVIPNVEREALISHLKDEHKFCECNQSKKFYRADHFRQHLKHTHLSCPGKWINMLLEACEIKETLDAGEENNASDSVINSKDLPPGGDLNQKSERVQNNTRSTTTAMTEYFNTCFNLTNDLLPEFVSFSWHHIAVRHHYVAVSLQARFLSFQLGLLDNLAQDQEGSLKSEELSRQRAVKTDELLLMRQALRRARKDCKESDLQQIFSNLDNPLDGLSLDIDAGPQTSDFSIPSSDTTYEDYRKSHEMFELREVILKSNLLGHWTSKRDRVNRWLLHSLLTDDSQAQNHKSATSSQDLNEPSWVRMVLQYWFVDEAATGVELASSLSGGAVASMTGSSLDSISDSVDF